jgi:hypothetical protein
MKRTSLVICAALVGTAASLSQAGMSRPEPTPAGAIMTARGTFEVRLIPRPSDEAAGGPFSLLYLDKRFLGDLTGTSKGHMLGAETAVEGSAGYVALELVTGMLNGRRGSFVLQHAGHMTRGVASMTATVVPDSGTDELAGLAGRLTISISEGQHSYAFEYSLGVDTTPH